MYTIVVAVRLLYIWAGFANMKQLKSIWNEKRTIKYEKYFLIFILIVKFGWFLCFMTAFTKDTPVCLEEEDEVFEDIFPFLLSMVVIELLPYACFAAGVLVFTFCILPVIIAIDIKNYS